MIIFDAHADLMQPTKNPSHEEVFTALIESGWKPENLVFIGLRKIEIEEKKVIDEKKIQCFSPEENNDKIISYLNEKTKGKEVYVTIDIDCLDPKFARGVSYPENNGMTKKQFFEILTWIKKHVNVQTYDVVEVVEKNDVHEKTITVAREIVDVVMQ